MIKNYKQYINEDLRNKNITLDISYINLARLYPKIQLRYNNEYKVVISSNTELRLNNEFYQALDKDNINKDDIVFENCMAIVLKEIKEFTKVLDYGVFGSDIKDFSCYECKNITSLEGSPDTVHHDFGCSICINLTSLDGAPEKVTGDFYCCNCTSLTSLKGAPKEVGVDFNCYSCKNLTSLDGAPKEVGGDFSCQKCTKLTSIDGAPEIVGGSFGCYDNDPDFIELCKQKYGSKVKS